MPLPASQRSLGHSSFQAPSLFGPELLVPLHIKVVTELWLLLLLFELALSFSQSCTPLLWGQGVQVHRHLWVEPGVYMAQVEGTRMYSRVFTSLCYHLPRSLGVMSSMGFLSLQNFHFFFFQLSLLVFPRLAIFFNHTAHCFLTLVCGVHSRSLSALSSTKNSDLIHSPPSPAMVGSKPMSSWRSSFYRLGPPGPDPRECRGRKLTLSIRRGSG